MYDSQAPILQALRDRGAPPAALDSAVQDADASGRPLRDVLVVQALVTDAELAAGLSAWDGYRDPFLFPDREDELR